MTELLREYWDWFLLDTLLWTGAIIGFVLLVRRPVARYLGAGTAYALWALPAFRLLIPPMTLPAWMAPEGAEIVAPVAETTTTTIAAQDFTYFTPASVAQTYAPATLPEPTDFVTPLVLLWLAGAIVFLVRRFWLYGQLRRELLDDAVPVGDVGAIRLVETPAISGPMAFGVLDKVVALPVGFMTRRDRTARDLAIAHELAHHRGHDLLANILVQPLFAAHWFNPLGYMGWTALRRDQEAACDARVVASRPREERAAYAGVIADFARRPQATMRPALAAPMACPVLGDKSIIHRLRNLSMEDVTPRRRMVARSGLAAALFALPMTASICYASATAAPPVPPVAPVAPVSPLAPDVPEPPAAPDAPEADWDSQMADLDRELAEADREIARAERELERELEDGRVVRERTIVRRNGKEVELTEEEREELRAELKASMAELRANFAENGEVRREIRMAMVEARAEAEEARAEALADAREARAEALVYAREARAEAMAHAPRVVMQCRDKENVVATQVDAKGRTTMFVCEANADRMAMKSLKLARKAIETDRNLSASERAEALRAIDEEIRKQPR
ncbi:M56 family metallopeptidase [Qipengyuania sp. 6B39]|uniref:M56 family metallopeptidase n=1 Tax=Qipengyuania proteolytica TaxID=2867239 RepID=UPI001C89AA38|nr:M56 family metallopeptidase [Qipengyuania proteolytica]MBX7496272.1 M56 family metallopeptidase [Qipengyuania proteolytica]